LVFPETEHTITTYHTPNEEYRPDGELDYQTVEFDALKFPGKIYAHVIILTKELSGRVAS